MQKTYLQRWNQYLKENTHESPDKLVHDKINTFVDETVDRFQDLMNELYVDLLQHGIPAGHHFHEVYMHFTREMWELAPEIIHKIHEDEAFDAAHNIAATHNTGTEH